MQEHFAFTSWNFYLITILFRHADYALCIMHYELIKLHGEGVEAAVYYSNSAGDES